MYLPISIITASVLSFLMSGFIFCLGDGGTESQFKLVIAGDQMYC